MVVAYESGLIKAGSQRTQRGTRAALPGRMEGWRRVARSAATAAVATTAAAVGATSKGSTGEKRHVRARVTGIATG